MATIPAEGTKLFVGSASTSTAMDSIAQITAITPPGFSRAAVAKPWLQNTWKAFRAGRIPDAGEVAFTLEFDPASSAHLALLTTYASASAPYWWQIQYADIASSTSAHPLFEGDLISAEPESLEDETNLVYNCTIKVTGSVTHSSLIG